METLNIYSVVRAGSLYIIQITFRSGDLSPTFHRGDTDLISDRSMWDLWWTSDPGTGFLFQVLRFPAVSIIPPLRYTQLRLSITVVRTRRRRLEESLEWAVLFRISWSAVCKGTFTLLLYGEMRFWLMLPSYAAHCPLCLDWIRLCSIGFLGLQSICL